MKVQSALTGLIDAYCKGYFPMADPKSGEIAWYRPDPRAILPLESFHTSRSLLRRLRRNIFDFSVDLDFRSVIRGCATAHGETWLSSSLIELYESAFMHGYAHSVEVWRHDELVGGIYGLSIGKAFFGESMFHSVTDASKAALACLIDILKQGKAQLLEVQFLTDHLKSLGAIQVSSERYLQMLHAAVSCQAIEVRPGRVSLSFLPKY